MNWVLYILNFTKSFLILNFSYLWMLNSWILKFRQSLIKKYFGYYKDNRNRSKIFSVISVRFLQNFGFSSVTWKSLNRFSFFSFITEHRTEKPNAQPLGRPPEAFPFLHPPWGFSLLEPPQIPGSFKRCGSWFLGSCWRIATWTIFFLVPFFPYELDLLPCLSIP